MAFEQPQSRNEAILQNMLGAENELVPPQSRIEALLQAILLQGVPDGAVTTDKLADGAVTYDKLAEALKNLINNKADKEGNWELIDTITVSDSDITQVFKNVDGNGNALNLKGIAFYIAFPADSRTSATTMNLRASPKTSDSDWVGNLNRTAIIGRTNTNVYWEVTAANGYWNDGVYEMSQGDNSITARTYMSVSASNSSILKRRLVSTNPNIKSYSAWVGGVGIPAGTTIQVFGIK